MLSIRCNSWVKSWKNKKRQTKNKKNKPFIDKCNWEGINYPLENDDWKKIEKSTLNIVLNIKLILMLILILPTLIQIAKKKKKIF